MFQRTLQSMTDQKCACLSCWCWSHNCTRLAVVSFGAPHNNCATAGFGARQYGNSNWHAIARCQVPACMLLGLDFAYTHMIERRQAPHTIELDIEGEASQTLRGNWNAHELSKSSNKWYFGKKQIKGKKKKDILATKRMIRKLNFPYTTKRHATMRAKAITPLQSFSERSLSDFMLTESFWFCSKLVSLRASRCQTHCIRSQSLKQLHRKTDFNNATQNER